MKNNILLSCLLSFSIALITSCNSCNTILPQTELLTPVIADRCYLSDIAIDGTHAMASIYCFKEDSLFCEIQCFELKGNSWQKIQTIARNCDSIFYPLHLAIDGNYAVVGHPSDCNYRSKAEVYVFRPDQWEHMQDLYPDDTAEMCYRGYGKDVDVYGDYAIVTNGPDANGKNGTYCAYIFKQSAFKWTQVAKIKNFSMMEDFEARLGNNICVFRTRSPKEQGDLILNNRIHVYVANSDGDWQETDLLEPKQGDTAAHYYASDFDFSTDYMVVSSHNKNITNATYKLYFYRLIKGKKFVLNTMVSNSGFSVASSDKFAINTVDGNFQTYYYKNGGYAKGNLYIRNPKVGIQRLAASNDYIMYAGSKVPYSSTSDSVYVCFQKVK
ncbi:MAG: hypothetical protein U0U67_03115 [Chitinophagales bacterium]